MKRLALLFLAGITFWACDNRMVPDPDPRGTEPGDVKAISLKIHVPPNSLSTYAVEDASGLENTIDSIYIYLYQTCPAGVGVRTFLDSVKFEITPTLLYNDSTIIVDFMEENISCSSTPQIDVEVFANKRLPKHIDFEEDIYPDPGDRETYFYMSGKATLEPPGTAYSGEVHIVRNVAKLRINISKYSVGGTPLVFPSDLEIVYNDITIQLLHAMDSTSLFEGDPMGSGIGPFDYAERSGPALSNTLRLSSSFDPNLGGQIDSLYLYENYSSNTNNATKIQITIPTTSSEGYKTSTFTYPLYTETGSYNVYRNYVYTLDLKVKAQNEVELIALDVRPWNDVPIDLDIGGTYLHIDQPELMFNPDGYVYINFCTDAQAIYFDFTEFNGSNSQYNIGTDLKVIGIDTSRIHFPLAPDGFQDGQILLDKEPCGYFGFKIDPNQFPGFPNVPFSGRICLMAGNIVRCLTFPASDIYDAHFIVGEPILAPDEFIKATVSNGGTGAGTWLEVSENILYTGTTQNYTYSGSGTGMPLYLHLNENLTGLERKGTITLTNSQGAEKRIEITQLPVINVGKFGYNPVSSSDDNIYTAYLYTEQRWEYNRLDINDNKTMPSFGATNLLPNNALYNGRFTAIGSAVDYNRYNNESFNYQETDYPAINYCAYKNRGTGPNGTLLPGDIKWYLPSQAQLLGMWITYESYKPPLYPKSNFNSPSQLDVSYNLPGDALVNYYWSSTANVPYFVNAQYPNAQYVSFDYGQVGNLGRSSKYWARCVRDGDALSPAYPKNMVDTIIISGFEIPIIYFDYGLPNDYFIFESKIGIQDDEASNVNQKVYVRLRVAKEDHYNGSLMSWGIDSCLYYSEPEDFSGTWRLPTQRELQAIWIFQDEMKTKCPTFELLDPNNYYWSGTNASLTSGSSAWTIWGGKNMTVGAGNAPHQPKSTPLRVRCVLQQMGETPP